MNILLLYALYCFLFICSKSIHATGLRQRAPLTSQNLYERNLVDRRIRDLRPRTSPGTGVTSLPSYFLFTVCPPPISSNFIASIIAYTPGVADGLYCYYTDGQVNSLTCVYNFQNGSIEKTTTNCATKAM